MPYAVANVGGRGDQSGAHADNGGFFVSLVAWGDMQGANGDALHVQAGCTIDRSDGGFVRLTSAGNFATGLENIYADCDFSATYADGRYNIIGSTVNSITINLAWSSDVPTATVRVGGALSADDAGLQVAFDLLPNITTDVIKLCVGSDPGATTGTITLSAGVDVDTLAGSAAEHIIVEGVDVSGVRLIVGDTLPIITTTSDLDVALLTFGSAADYYDFYFLDFDAGGDEKADRCLLNAVGLTKHFRFFDCKFHNAEDELVSWASKYSLWQNCEFYDADKAGAGGVTAVKITGEHASLIGCSIHDNPGNGWNPAGPYCRAINNTVYNNGGIGLSFGAGADHATCIGNTVYSNGGVGISINTGADLIVCFNNTSNNNTGDDWDLDNDDTHFLFFGNNHAYGGANLISDGMTWADVGDGNNITGEPLFLDAAGGNYTPVAASPLRDAGLFGDYIGAVPPQVIQKTNDRASVGSPIGAF